MQIADAFKLIRQIPDYPKSGILFQDITPLLANPQALAAICDGFQKCLPKAKYIIGIEARGFILGAALAAKFEMGFIPLRKVGKLPYKTFSATYGLEYGLDELEIHIDALSKGDQVIIIDDVLATGGTLNAAMELVEKCGATTLAIAVLLEIPGLGGRAKITAKYPDLPIQVLQK